MARLLALVRYDVALLLPLVRTSVRTSIVANWKEWLVSQTRLRLNEIAWVLISLLQSIQNFLSIKRGREQNCLSIEITITIDRKLLECWSCDQINCLSIEDGHEQNYLSIEIVIATRSSSLKDTLYHVDATLEYRWSRSIVMDEKLREYWNRYRDAFLFS